MNTDTLTAPADLNPALVAFFKSLSDVRRLQIAGRLAAGELSAAQLAEALGEPAPAVRRHLADLCAAGLVDGPHGAAQTYRLRRDQLQALAAQVFARPVATVPETDDQFAAKVLRDFLNADGSLRELPAQEKKFGVVLRHGLQVFELGARYTEKEVNERLARLHPDTATLRRALIDRHWMERERAGGSYWRVEGAG